MSSLSRARQDVQGLTFTCKMREGKTGVSGVVKNGKNEKGQISGSVRPMVSYVLDTP